VGWVLDNRKVPSECAQLVGAQLVGAQLVRAPVARSPVDPTPSLSGLWKLYVNVAGGSLFFGQIHLKKALPKMNSTETGLHCCWIEANGSRDKLVVTNLEHTEHPGTNIPGSTDLKKFANWNLCELSHLRIGIFASRRFVNCRFCELSYCRIIVW
jgi:hypothetical protein